MAQFPELVYATVLRDDQALLQRLRTEKVSGLPSRHVMAYDVDWKVSPPTALPAVFFWQSNNYDPNACLKNVKPVNLPKTSSTRAGARNLYDGSRRGAQWPFSRLLVFFFWFTSSCFGWSL